MVLARFEDKVKKLKAKIAEEEKEQRELERQFQQTSHIPDKNVEIGEGYLTDDQARVRYHQKQAQKRKRTKT